jgi:hypothetical protein
MTIRPAYSKWPNYNRSLRDVIAGMTDEQLAITPAPDRWPLWATVGHLACQRVSGLCGLAGEPGADSTPFANALYNCPGDEDLEHVLSASQLAEALDSTFRIVESCLDTWTFETLEDPIRRQFGSEESVYSRGGLIQGAFVHDVYHIAELNEALGVTGLTQVNLWQ